MGITDYEDYAPERTEMSHTQFANGVTFSGRFDSGNLARAEHVQNSEFMHEYRVWTRPDAAGTANETTFRTWFYFAVQGNALMKGTVIKITAMNLNGQGKLYGNGLRPFYRSFPSNPTWKRVSYPVDYRTTGTDSGRNFELTFRHTIMSGPSALVQKPGNLVDDNNLETHFFAFCFPMSCGETNRMLAAAEERLKLHPRIFFQREVLTHSLEGRVVEVVTITDHDGKSSESESCIEDIFPENNRPPLFSNRKTMFLSSGVHPGETPGRHVFNGFFNFITDEEDPRAQCLRSNFVFKLVPMINPDGIYNGHYRADTLGQNLNRHYSNPSKDLQPSVFAIKKVIEYLHNDYNLFLYLDLHGHASKRGCFLYGNCLQGEDQIDNVLYAKLIALSSPHLDFDACNFTEKNMRAKDKREKTGNGKEGSGRVALYHATGLKHCYTMECNYNTGRVVNYMHPPCGLGNRPGSPRGRPDLAPYTIEDFEQVGKGCAVALLDLLDVNPHSRIPNSEYRSLEGVRAWVQSRLHPQLRRSLRSERILTRRYSDNAVDVGIDKKEGASAKKPKSSASVRASSCLSIGSGSSATRLPGKPSSGKSTAVVKDVVAAAAAAAAAYVAKSQRSKNKEEESQEEITTSTPAVVARDIRKLRPMAKHTLVRNSSTEVATTTASVAFATRGSKGVSETKSNPHSVSAPPTARRPSSQTSDKGFPLGISATDPMNGDNPEKTQRVHTHEKPGDRGMESRLPRSTLLTRQSIARGKSTTQKAAQRMVKDVEGNIQNIRLREANTTVSRKLAHMGGSSHNAAAHNNRRPSVSRQNNSVLDCSMAEAERQIHVMEGSENAGMRRSLGPAEIKEKTGYPKPPTPPQPFIADVPSYRPPFRTAQLSECPDPAFPSSDSDTAPPNNRADAIVREILLEARSSCDTGVAEGHLSSREHHVLHAPSSAGASSAGAAGIAVSRIRSMMASYDAAAVKEMASSGGTPRGYLSPPSPSHDKDGGVAANERRTKPILERVEGAGRVLTQNLRYVQDSPSPPKKIW
eukprot:Rmarinus@m.3740